MIPYGKQQISDADIDAVVEVLRSDFLTQGQRTVQFEQDIAGYCHAQGAVAVTSATAALHLACLALEVGPDDLVWTSPVSFVASSNAALYCGADVDFVDIDGATGLMCPSALEQKLNEAKSAGRLPKVIIPVHLGGQSCDMQAIRGMTNPLGIALIEDASHAIGARYEQAPVGSCAYSDICVFSFHPVKIITTGEGGVLTANDKALLKQAAMLRSHGITRDEEQFTEHSHGPWYYQQLALGFNYRMTELQAALGSSQLTRVDEFVARRQTLASRYTEFFSQASIARYIHPMTTPLPQSSAWHLYIVQVTPSIRDDLFGYLRNHGIQVNLHYIPIHLQPYYQKLGFEKGDFPVAEQYYQQAISLPLFAGLTDEQQLTVMTCISEFCASLSL